MSNRLLLDTQALLWWLKDERRLSSAARRAIAHIEHPRYFSIAGAWELTIKCADREAEAGSARRPAFDEHLAANRTDILGITLTDLIPSRVARLAPPRSLRLPDGSSGYRARPEHRVLGWNF